MRRATLLLLIACAGLLAAFTYNPPGVLVSGSGQGRVDAFVYVPDMRFPIEQAPAFLNSQVWGHGGYQGPGGGQCDPNNYSYPWSDNYCESRSWTMPLCPTGNGHQGQDIRPSTCADKTHWVVATEDGTITNVGSYSVYLTTANGTRHRFLHMDPASVQVSVGQSVRKGQRLGLVSNAFGGTPTTIHLHYDIYQNVSGYGSVYVPTYMSLITSYERLIGETGAACAVIPAQGGILDESGPCFFSFGPSQYWRQVTGQGYDNTLMWTNAFQSDGPSNWARWQLHFEEAGDYTLEVRATGQYAVHSGARYGVRAAGADSTITIDQSAAGTWKSLGTFSFEAGGSQHLDLYDNVPGSVGSDQHIMADAIRLTRLGINPPDPGTDTSPPPTDTNPPPTDTASPLTDTGSGEDTAGGGILGDGGPVLTRPDIGSGGEDTLSPADTSSAQVQSDCACSVRATPEHHTGLWSLGAMLLGLLWWRRQRM